MKIVFVAHSLYRERRGGDNEKGRQSVERQILQSRSRSSSCGGATVLSRAKADSGIMDLVRAVLLQIINVFPPIVVFSPQHYFAFDASRCDSKSLHSSNGYDNRQTELTSRDDSLFGKWPQPEGMEKGQVRVLSSITH